jgi:hypothetical protein
LNLFEKLGMRLKGALPSFLKKFSSFRRTSFAGIESRGEGDAGSPRKTFGLTTTRL